MSGYIIQIEEFLNADWQAMFKFDSSLDGLYALFAHPRVPLYAVFLYLLLSKNIFSLIVRTFNVKPKGKALQALTIVHSGILAVYSGWTFFGTLKIVVPYILKNGFYPSLCDVDGNLWSNEGLGWWIAHFYLSKYYEFIDTWIVLLKGRDPIFLQTYHHAGIVILMWGFVVTANTCGGLITTLFNSFIHTLMYTYYTLAAFGYSSPLKHYLTQAQMIQFVIGIILTVPTLFMSGCVNPAQSLVIITIQLYAVVLIALFYQFYVNSYSKAKADKASKAAAATAKKAE